MNLRASSSEPPRFRTLPQAARKLNLPFPDVLGLGVMISTPGLTRSGQSLIPLGLPLRTTNTIVEKYGSDLLGSFSSQVSLISPFFRRASVSDQRASVTTSASRPSR